MGSTYLDRVGNKALGQMLVEKGALSDDQVNEALDHARSKGVRLGEALVELGYIGTDALSYAIAEQYGQRPMELHPSMVDPDLLVSFDAELLYRHVMLPLIELGNDLVVVVADPNNQAGLDALVESRPGINITPQLGAEGQILRCLETFFPGVAAEVASAQDGDGGAGSVQSARQLRGLDDFNGVPSPGSADFLSWLMSTAAAHPGVTVMLKRRGDGLQAMLLAKDGGKRELGEWKPVSFAAVLKGILTNASAIPFTRHQAWQMTAPARLGDDEFGFTVLTPIAQAEPFMRLCALRRAQQDVEGGATDPGAQRARIVPKPGECLVVEVDKNEGPTQTVTGQHGQSQTDTDGHGPDRTGAEGYAQAEKCAGSAMAYAREAALLRQVILISSSCAVCDAELPVYPAPFVDVVAAAQAHAADCVVFDYMPSRADLARLMTATSTPPGIVIFVSSSAAGNQFDDSLPWPDARRITMNELFSEGGQA